MSMDSLRLTQAKTPDRLLQITTSLSEMELRDAMADAIPYALKEQAERIAYEMQPELQHLIAEQMLDHTWVRQMIREAFVEAAATILRLEIQNP